MELPLSSVVAVPEMLVVTTEMKTSDSLCSSLPTVAVSSRLGSGHHFLHLTKRPMLAPQVAEPAVLVALVWMLSLTTMLPLQEELRHCSTDVPPQLPPQLPLRVFDLGLQSTLTRCRHLKRASPVSVPKLRMHKQ